jgi:hypothetical protein
MAAFAVLLALAAGCGGGGSSESAGGQAPQQLLGTYTTMLEQSDVEAAGSPPEIAGPDRSWTLRILNAGGPDNGPVLAIDNETAGNLEAPSLRVEGDRLLLRNEECAAGGQYKFYDNEYAWKLSGKTLTIMPVTNHCSDRVALTILTSHAWTKTTATAGG